MKSSVPLYIQAEHKGSLQEEANLKQNAEDRGGGKIFNLV